MRFCVKGAPAQVEWPTATEQAWNYMRQVQISSSVLKRPDIGLSDRFLIASILCQPADQRPWGIVTWLADFYQTTRQTIYTIANSILYPFTVVGYWFRWVGIGQLLKYIAFEKESNGNSHR